MEDFTSGQEKVVHFLFTTNKSFTANAISRHLNTESGLNDWSYDRVHSILKRLEKRGIVWRNSNPAYWRLTKSGSIVYEINIER
jgi:predicted transcriptional regulator